MKSLTETVLEEPCRNLETYSYSVLYSSSFGSGGNDPFLYGYDMPGLGVQVHFHGPDEDHLTFGKVKSYEGETLTRIRDSCELAMLDYNALSSGLKRFP
ncbi:MAG: hypothetical protein PHO02_02835 [Candidatus Nanoarchaeia archaeon]|nr:hypothetical protein [Candidatus Nanoarchaeia archaeon]